MINVFVKAYDTQADIVGHGSLDRRPIMHVGRQYRPVYRVSGCCC